MKLKNTEIRIETTNKCNSNCTICPRDQMTRVKTVMPYHHFEELVWQSYWMGAKMISLFGYGEPLMDEELPQKVALCSMLGLQSNITTNAALLTEGLSKDLLHAGLSQIRFSVHGWGENYEKVHRGLKWEKVSKNIGQFLKFNDVTGHQCEVHVTVIPLHGETLDQIIDKWEPGGSRIRVDHLEVWRPHNWGGLKDYRRLNHRIKTCGRPFTGPIQIDANGNMIVCCFDINSKMVVGDTYKDTIVRILKGGEFEKIRAAHRCGDHSGLLCEHCDQLNVEPVSPLLYSTVDPSCKVGRTSSTKFQLKEK